MRKAITYTGFTQRNGKIEIVQTVSDERIAMDTLIELRNKMLELYNSTGFENVYQDIQAINRTVEILSTCEE